MRKDYVKFVCAHFVAGRICFLALIFMTVGSVAAGQSLTHVASIRADDSTQHSNAWSVFVAGDHAFVGTGAYSASLDIFDVSSPGTPVRVGKSVSAGQVITSVIVSGTIAYVGSTGALEILDVSNVSAPRRLSSFVFNGVGNFNGPNALSLQGNYLYVAASSSGVVSVLDVSNPSAPLVVGSIADGQGGAKLKESYTIITSGNYAYVSLPEANTVEVLDISSPTHPIHKSQISLAEGFTRLKAPEGMWLSGNLLYVACTFGGSLQILDVSDPAHPKEYSYLLGDPVARTLSEPSGIFISGDYAFIGDVGWNAIDMIDISNPKVPKFVAGIWNGDQGARLYQPVRLTVSGNYLYVASEADDALEIISITPGRPYITDDAGCATDSVHFAAHHMGVYDSLVWNFGDAESGNNNTAHGLNAVHKFSEAGTFHIRAETYSGTTPRIIVDSAIVVHAAPVINLGRDTTVCQHLTLSIAPGGYTQLWSTGSVSQSIDIDATGSYSVVVTSKFCTASDTIKVTIVQQPEINIPHEIISCSGTLTLDAGSPEFNTLWSTGEKSSVIHVSDPGVYYVTVTNGICSATDTIQVAFDVLSSIMATESKDTVDYNQSVQFHGSGSGVSEWNWDFDDGSIALGLTVSHVFTAEGDYVIWLHAAGSLGCVDSVSLKLHVNPYLFIPNVFTPNLDGKNDKFSIVYNGDQQVRIQVINRWGKEVFQSSDKDLQWDGGTEDAAVYFYRLEIGIRSFKGWVQLIR